VLVVGDEVKLGLELVVARSVLTLCRSACDGGCQCSSKISRRKSCLRANCHCSG